MTAKELNDKLFRIWISELIILTSLGIIALIINNYTSFRLITFDNNDPFIIILVFSIFSVISFTWGSIYSNNRLKTLKKEKDSLVKAIEYKNLYYRRVSIISGIYLFCIALYNSTNLTFFLIFITLLILLVIAAKPVSIEKLEEYLS